MTTPESDVTATDSTTTGEAEPASADAAAEELTTEVTVTAEGTGTVIDPDRVRSQQ